MQLLWYITVLHWKIRFRVSPYISNSYSKCFSRRRDEIRDLCAWMLLLKFLFLRRVDVTYRDTPFTHAMCEKDRNAFMPNKRTHKMITENKIKYTRYRYIYKRRRGMRGKSEKERERKEIIKRKKRNETKRFEKVLIILFASLTIALLSKE